MANLVDDYKNMIPGGVRIRDGVVTVPNSLDNGIEPLNLYEAVICEKTNITNVTTFSLYFNSDVTQRFIIFTINETGSSGDGPSVPAANFLYNIKYQLCSNEHRIFLATHVVWRETQYIYSKNQRWLVLRIA